MDWAKLRAVADYAEVRYAKNFNIIADRLDEFIYIAILYEKQEKIEVCDSFQGIKKQATSHKAACDCHNSKCNKSEFVD